MEMKTKVALGVIAVVLAAGGYLLFLNVSAKQDRAEATRAADHFIRASYESGNDISRAYELVSDGFRALQSESAVLGIRNSAERFLGHYISHGVGTDVTAALAPGAPRNVKLIKFDVAYENDSEGRIIAAMVKERGKWRVHEFNINSPRITEAELSQMLGPRSEVSPDEEATA